MARKPEWFRIVVIGKRTRHEYGPAVVEQIHALLRKFGIPHHEVTFEGWGDEPDAATRRSDNRGWGR